jgi:hypothetical protein
MMPREARQPNARSPFRQSPKLLECRESPLLPGPDIDAR